MFNAFEYKAGTIKLVDANLLAIDEFKNILDSDENSDKKLAFRIFTFLYLYCDTRSHLNKEGYSEVETLRRAKQLAKLPQDWVPDSNVKAAIEVYKTFPHPVKREIYIALKRSFKYSGKVIEKSRELLERILDKDDTDITIEDIETCQKSLDKLLDIALELPKRLSKLEEAEQMIDDANVVLRGGKELKASHDPSNDE